MHPFPQVKLNCKKGIYSQYDKSNQEKLILGKDENGYFYPLTWDQWKALNYSYTPIQHNEDCFISGLMIQIKQFNKKIEINGVLRSSKLNGFINKVNYILKHSKAKYLKSGLKITRPYL